MSTEERVERVKYFPGARDYVDEKWPRRYFWEYVYNEKTEQHDRKMREGMIRAVLPVLAFLVRHAMYDKCSDDVYGDVAFDWCGVKSISFSTGCSESDVKRALATLEDLGSIKRDRGGRRAGKPDRISVRPVLDQAAEWAVKRDRDEKLKPYVIPADDRLELTPGLVYSVNGTAYQLGKVDHDLSETWQDTVWRVWCHEEIGSLWKPSTDPRRPGQWYREIKQENIRESAWVWYQSPAFKVFK